MTARTEICRLRPRAVAVLAASVLLVPLVGCAGGDEPEPAAEVPVANRTVEAEAWLVDVCGFLVEVDGAVRGVIAFEPDDLEGDLDPTAVDGQRALIETIDDRVVRTLEAVDRADRGVAALGIPDSIGGLELVELVRVGLADVRARHQQVRDGLARAEVGDAAGFAESLSGALSRLDQGGSAFADLVVRLEGDSTYAPTWFQDPACEGL